MYMYNVYIVPAFSMIYGSHTKNGKNGILPSLVTQVADTPK